MEVARIRRAHGALVEAAPLGGVALYELVRVGERGLLGEVVRIDGERASIQVFEETTGLAIGEPVMSTGNSLRAELGPGLLGAILDGVGHPLAILAERAGSFLTPGLEAPTLDPDQLWQFAARQRPGAELMPGDILGIVEEKPGFEHRVLVPPHSGGQLAELGEGAFRVHDVLGRMADGTPLRLAQHWPVRRVRPSRERRPIDRPLVTSQRIFDLLFPVAEGGTVALPGGFGAGKTVIEQSLAKYCQADVIVYIGCGERGNEIAAVLDELPALQDPGTGGPLLDRTVLVVNTSNMPVAARDASVFLGMTIGEFYRDMGYRVAVLADSISRWAEAQREIGARLGDMPGEEGYPTSLANRLGQLYERAGRVQCSGRPERTGSLTFVSAISPPGGDFSEPVTQASLRVTGALWALSSELAQRRQYPAVDWQTSYSLYADATSAWFEKHGGPGWSQLRHRLLALLDRDQELSEVAGLVGADALEDPDRLLLEVARSIRDALLGQSAYDANDAASSPRKTWQLARGLISLADRAAAGLDAGRSYEQLALAPIRRALLDLRAAAEEDVETRARAMDDCLDALGPAPPEDAP